MENKKLTILSGAGISAESGLKTFRGEDGLWEGYDIMKVASIEGWHENPALILEFYNKRRLQLGSVEPNSAHKILAELENHFDTMIVTQNVDDLHERGGSSNVIHLHGQLNKIKSSINPSYSIDFHGEQALGDLCPEGGQLRPDIVWFGEAVPLFEIAAERVSISDIVIIVGTSMQVYPAAGLVSYASDECEIFYIDPQPQMNQELVRLKKLRIIEKNATDGMQIVFKHLTK